MSVATLRNRVLERTTTTGIGPITLAGVPDVRYQTFLAALGAGALTFYCIVHEVLNEWEAGVGQVNANGTLTRIMVIKGTAGTSLVNFSAGTKEVFVDVPAEKMLAYDADSNQLSLPGALAVSGAASLSAGFTAGASSSVSAGIDADSDFAIGAGGGAPTASRTASLTLNAPDSGSFRGAAKWFLKRAASLVWAVGLFSAVAGAMTSVTDLAFAPNPGTSPVAALSTAGDLRLSSTLLVGADPGGPQTVRVGGTMLVSGLATLSAGTAAVLTFGTHLTGTSFNSGANVTLGTDAASANTASTIVARDGSGNFAAGTITASLTGTATNVPAAGVTGAQTLAKADDTNVTLSLGGTPATALLQPVTLTLGWTGQLAAGRGGTGIGLYAAGDLLYATGASTLAKLAIGAANRVLTSTGSAPQWSANLAYAALPTGNGSWDTGAGTAITITRSLVVGSDPGGSDLLRVGGAATLSGAVTVGGLLKVNYSGSTQIEIQNPAASAGDFRLVAASTASNGFNGFGLFNVGTSVYSLKVDSATDAATFSGRVTASSGLTVSGGSTSVSGSIVADATFGTTLWSVAGATDDFTILSPAGGYLLHFPHGTTTATFAGAATFSGAIASTATGVSAFGAGLTTQPGDVTLRINSGTNGGTNGTLAQLVFQRGGTDLWQTGVLGSVATDGAYRIYNSGLGATALSIATATGAVVIGSDPGGSDLLRVGGAARFSGAVSGLSYQLTGNGGALAASARYIDGGGTATYWQHNTPTGGGHAFSVNGSNKSLIDATGVTVYSGLGLYFNNSLNNNSGYIYNPNSSGTALAVVSSTVTFTGSIIAGTGSGLTFSSGGGLQMGAPTGGDKGAGTINVAGDIYKNNTAYTNPDYVLEHLFTGKVERFKDQPGADRFEPLTLSEVREHARRTLRLPGIDDEPLGMFGRADLLLEHTERLYGFLWEHDDRLTDHERRLAALEARTSLS